MKKLMILAAVCLLSAMNSMAQVTLSISDFSIKGGEEKAIEIELENPGVEITGVQCDLILPAGLSLTTFLNEDEDENVLGELISNRKKGDLGLTVSEVSGGYRFIVFSMNNKTFKGTSGGIIKVVVKAASTISAGNLTGTLADIVLTEPDQTQHKPANFTFNITATTGINEVELSNDKPATIYDLKGNTIRKNATSTEGLSKGVYIIDNKKVIVK
ncbi:MAG: hypothetical protein J6V87_00470 [Prevotella sp.]|nr:hypothetical protein [Prevotella sp.]